jgi:hypothetical protein
VEKEGRSKVVPPWMGERVVVAALNLGEIKMNERERLFGRERVHGRKERESQMLVCSMCERRERERKTGLHVCEKTHNPYDTFSSA